MKYLSWSFRPADRRASAFAKNSMSNRAVSDTILHCLVHQFPFELYAVTGMWSIDLR